MVEGIAALWASFAEAAEKLVWLTLVFGLLSLLIKKGAFVVSFRQSLGETRLNLVYWATDALAVAPVMVVAAAFVERLFASTPLAAACGAWLATSPPWLALLLGIAVSDFAGYWRHRLMHTTVLWPAHAIHHSDRAMTWLALIRFHPVNRLITTAINMAALAALGFPAWVVFINGVVRNLYGFFVHADVPWTYGALGRVFVSPVMHRWHHVRDVAVSGSNFATVFSLFDVMFGTYRVPGRAVPPLGIDEPGFPGGWLGQTLWPLRCWAAALRRHIPLPRPLW